MTTTAATDPQQPMSHYDRTGYCSRCDRYYGQHNSGCPLEGTTPACMGTSA